MKFSTMLIAGVALALFVVLPSVLCIVGLGRAPAARQPKRRWDIRLSLASMLLYVLAFNLTFFIQEFFLALPKTLTPGLRVTLYHNNQIWQGTSPLAALFQGTGALATCISALVCALLLVFADVRSTTWRLFLLWMVASGAFMALPQVAVGALSAGGDLGMAMGYFHLGINAKTALALAALAVMPVIGLLLAREWLVFDGADGATGARDRARFVFGTVVLPAIAALPVIVAFRVPRSWLEVLFLPVVVTWFGTIWIQAGACWLDSRPRREAGSHRVPLVMLFLAALALLLVFQLILRPGIRLG
jgi:hypothetical protein